MSVLGKLHASLAAASQETTLALANANFDFSLIKCEAPSEYRQLGLALAEKKRSMAEEGPAHTTAKRLGSLFQTMLPETPNLIRAYGRRASQIAQSEIANPRGTDADGAFKDYVGIDGTSIWAAATSSPAAIATHLLACMIAAVWPADEATAIWVELVTERKRTIEEKAASTDLFDLGEALSSKLDVTNEQLANWDASARAWLAAADASSAIKEKQKAVRSVVNRINMPVSSRQDVYTSVTEAWRLSLETFEKIILGSSYSIQDGAVMLGLVAWHIYPDLVMLGRKTVDIPQHDELVEAGGIVTIGMRSISTNPDGASGVRWSLSLAHLRYYGSKRTTSRSLVYSPSGANRFSFIEFTLACLGAMIANWQKSESVTIDAAFSFLRLFIDKYQQSVKQPSVAAETPVDYDDIQLQPLQEAMSLYYSDSIDDRSHAMKCISLGMRNSNFVLDKSSSILMKQSHYRFFGLDTVRFVYLLEEEEDQNKFMREAIKRFQQPRPKGFPATSPYFLLVRSVKGREEVCFYSKKKIRNWAERDKDCDFIRKVHRDGGYAIESLPGSLQEDARYLSSDIMRWQKPPPPIQKLLRKLVEKERGTTSAELLDELMQQFHVMLKTAQYKVLVPALQSFNIWQTREVLEGHLRQSRLSTEGCWRFMREPGSCLLLRLLSAGWSLSSCTPSVTVSPRVLESQSLLMLAHYLSFSGSSQWGSRGLKNGAFQLVTYLEIGSDPGFRSWEKVLAISTEDTIYVDPTLMRSPSSQTISPYELRRIRGNVGRAGLSLIGWFSNDEKPECRKPDVTQWQVINHRPFDGKLEDAFASTSLHLRFTDYVRDVDFGAHNRIASAAMVDGLLSAYDAGTWLCDMDVLSALSSRWVKFIRQLPDCEGGTPIIGTKPPGELVTIENWEELLSPHATAPAVVKCHGNWQARLTALSIGAQHHYRTLVFDGHGCWNCAFKLLEEWETSDKEKDSDDTASTASEERDTEVNDAVVDDKSETTLVAGLQRPSGGKSDHDEVNSEGGSEGPAEDVGSEGSASDLDDDTSVAGSIDDGKSSGSVPVIFIL